MSNFIETFTKLYEEVEQGEQKEYTARNTEGDVYRVFKKGNPVAVTGPMTKDQAADFIKANER